jgi:hypothetical protein
VGLGVSGARVQAGSAFAGIGDTVAIGLVLYDSGFPIVPTDKLWVPAREDPARFTVIPIGDIHIFIGETNPTPATETNFRRIGMAEIPKRTAFELDTEEDSFDLELSKFPSVGVIPNRYTSDVVLNQQARVAHQGWYGRFAIPGGPVAEANMAVLDAGAYGRSGDRPMAGYWRLANGGSGHGPWRVTLWHTRRTLSRTLSCIRSGTNV